MSDNNGFPTGTGFPAPSSDDVILNDTQSSASPDTVIPQQIVLGNEPEATVAAAAVAPAETPSEQVNSASPVTPGAPAAAVAAATTAAAVTASTHAVTSTPEAPFAASQPVQQAPSGLNGASVQPVQPSAPQYGRPQQPGTGYGARPAGAPSYGQPGYGSRIQNGTPQRYGARPAGAPSYGQPGYGSRVQTGEPPKPPIDYEAIRRKEHAKRELYKKVKSRYTAASMLPFITGIFLTLINIIFCFWMGSVGSGRSADSMLKKLDEIQQFSYALSGIVIVPVSIIVLIIFFKKTKIGSLKDFFPRSPGLISYCIFGTLTAIALSAALNLINICLGFASDTVPASSFSSLYSYDTVLPFVFQIAGLGYICLIGPIMEELLYRGLCLNLCSHISRNFALFTSAFMFALMHLNIQQFLTTFLLGMVLAYVALKSHSLLPTILMHIAYNTTTMLVDAVKFNASTADDLGAPAFGLFILFLIGGMCFITLLVKNKKIDERTDGMKQADFFTPEELPLLNEFKRKQITSSAFFSTWSFWGVIGLYVANIIIIVVAAMAIITSMI